jgi:hypothetical protein
MSKSNELSQENQTFRGIKIPAIINFYEFTGTKKFNGNEYSKLQEEEDKKYEAKLNKYMYYKRMKIKYAIPKKRFFIILGIIIFIVLKILIPKVFILKEIEILSLGDLRKFEQLKSTYDFFHSLIPIVLPLAITLGVWAYFKNRFEKLEKNHKISEPSEIDIIKEKKHEYLISILNIIKNEYLQNFRILHVSKYEKLFFGNEGCALVNVESGRIILYAKENIKNVLLEHKHL